MTTGGSSFAERYPRWLVITAALFAAFIITALVVLILTDHSIETFTQFLTETWAGILALFATGNALQARDAARKAVAEVDRIERAGEAPTS